MPKKLFGWRHALASENGPENATTRHVLLTLSLHMSTRGDSCFPSLPTLATETGLCKSTVCRHIDRATSTGWLQKKSTKRGNGGDSSNRYIPRVPDGFEYDEQQQFTTEEGGCTEQHGGGEGCCTEQHPRVAENNPNVNTTTSNTTTVDTGSDEPGASHPSAHEDSTTVEWESPTELFDDAEPMPMPTGDGAPAQEQQQTPQFTSVQDVREYVGAGDNAGNMGWRVGDVFRQLFCPWLSDDDFREPYFRRLMKEANRMVGEVKHDGTPMDKPRSRIELAVALLHLYQERDDLHGRSDPGARKDQPTAVLNVIADQITRKVKDDEQQRGNDFRPDDPIHQLVREAEQSHS